MYQKMKQLRRRKRYQVALKAHNTGNSESPLWEMWIEGAYNAFPRGNAYAMTPSQAISHKVAIEKATFHLNNTLHVSGNGRPVASKYHFSFEII